jgi:type IV pilus assembly protein PilC
MKTPSLPQFLRFSIGQQALFTRRLSLYLHSGIPISHALAFIRDDATSKSITHILTILGETVASGIPLSEGLRKFPKQFSAFTVGFVQAGEASGTLSGTLARLGVVLAKREALRRKLLSALAYPALILCGTLGITLFLTLFIFPKIVPVLEGFRTKLPFTTRTLIAINNLCTHNWLYIFLGLFGIGITAISALRFTGVRKFQERVLLRIPLLSALYRYYVLATFSRSLALQLKGGIRILPALALIQESLPGTIYPQALVAITDEVRQGHRLSKALREHSKLFPSLTWQMVAAGEITGTLSANLELLADTYEETLDDLTKNLTVLIEPALMVCMGFMVGFVALAIITPIYAVTQNLNVK